MKDCRYELTDAGRTVVQQERDSGAQVRIISGSVTSFIRESYDWWRDGCRCTACTVIDSYEKGDSSHQWFETRMQVLADEFGHRHGDGVWIGQGNLWSPMASRSAGTRQRPVARS